MTDSPEQEATPKHPRKTKAEREAERQAKLKAEADKPLDPMIWILFGGILLIVTVVMFIDPFGATDTQTRGAEGVQFVLAIIYSVLGKNVATLLLGALGSISLIVGIVGWFKKRLGQSGAN
ncbi:MAG: hypothetical protein ABI970_15500 [Chloroflexota bacterium]